MTRLVAELTGADLALWVARAAKLEWPRIAFDICRVGPLTAPLDFTPHEDWKQGGPIIERANISLHPPTSPVHRSGGPNAGAGQSGVWSACTWTRGANGKRAFGMDDRSPLVAAMRCYVRYVYGNAVPDEVAP
jgi:hypothetical protein